MAKYIFQYLAKKNGLKVSVDSAGITAQGKQPMSANAEIVLKNNNIPVKDVHKSQRLSPKLVNDSDIIITVTPQHQNNVIWKFPEAEGKTIHLPEPVLDPFMGNIGAYEDAYDDIYSQIGPLIRKLKRYYKDNK